MRTLGLLIVCWAPGLVAYAVALRLVHGEALSLLNWAVVGLITLDVWLVASVLITLPLLRRLAARRAGTGRPPVLVAGVVLAVVPLWLTLTLWYGWHPRNLASDEAGLLGLLYGTSSIVLGLRFPRRSRPYHPQGDP